MMKLEKDIIRVTKQLEEERRRWTQRIEEEKYRANEQVEKNEVTLRKLEDEHNKIIKRLEEERSRLEEERNILKSQLDEERNILKSQIDEERNTLKSQIDEERKKIDDINEKHKIEMEKDRKNVIQFVMRLEGRDRLLSDVLGRVEDGHLSQVVRQLLHNFHIRLLGVDCGLNFLMEVPASRWREGVQEQLQVVLSGLVPETNRQKVKWSSVMQDLDINPALPTPETVISLRVNILNRSRTRAFLSGPPGTGKTIALINQGLTWLQHGLDVHVVSTWYGSRAATFVIEHQLQETVKTSTTRSGVLRYQFEFWKDGEVETAVRRLKSLSKGRQLCVIADEAIHEYRKSFTEFCYQLIKQVPGVFIWGASVYHDVRPLCLEEVKMTTPLRSPPVVVREVMESQEIKNKRVHEYTVSDVPVPTDGPPVMRFKHLDGQSGHTWDRPLDCVKCGHQVARVLRELDVGRTGDSNGHLSLHYRDVMVVCEYYPTDDCVDSNGQVATTASGLVRGLRDRHVPVRVLKKGDEAAIRDTALGVGDLVTVANWRDVQGLERKVVVVERKYRVLSVCLHAMSRCTSQLVVIEWWPDF